MNSLKTKIVSSVKQIYSAVPNSYKPGPYRSTSALVEKSNYWSKQRHDNYQSITLNTLITHAYYHVPYYHKLFSSLKLKPDDFKSIQDLNKLPFLTKRLIQKHRSELVSLNISKFLKKKVTTGGSTGEPLIFFQKRFHSETRELAFIHDLWKRCGISEKTPKAVLRGSANTLDAPISFNRLTNSLTLSTFRSDDESLFEYAEAIRNYDIEFLHAHVSSAVVFANFLIRNGLTCPLKVVFGASENVYPFQRELIRKAFSARLFTWYGQSEQVVLAGECEYSEKYHCFPQYGITELVDGNGNNITTPGVQGEIVGTGFNNPVMPFIRYKTGDIASFAEGTCQCGRRYQLIDHVEGRSNEYIFTSNGRQISIRGLIFGKFLEAFKKIERIQLYQEKEGEVTIRVVKTPGYSVKDEKEIKEKIYKLVPFGLDISFEYLDHLPPTVRGKHPFLIQKISRDATTRNDPLHS